MATFLTMTISFNQSILLLGLLLIASPFHPPDWRWQQAVQDLPLFRLIYQRWFQQRQLPEILTDARLN